MKAEDLVLDEGSEGEKVEQICKIFPDVGVAVLPQALIVEAIDLSDLARLVVTSQDSDALWVSNFEGDQQSNGLHGEVASINVVAYLWSEDSGA